MPIKETLQDIADLAKYYRIDKPYIVGGLPRDIYLQKEIKTTDVDLTTNSPDVMRLGVLTADELNVPFEMSDDGHLTVFSDEFDIDFSSHFISEDVVSHLGGRHKGFEEAFSRDFTINTLHQDLETGEFFDPTGLAVDDINNKVIRTPVPVELTFADDPRRVYRAINLAVRYDFSIDKEIVSFVKENISMFSSENIKDKYITLKINKALNVNSEKTVNMLKELGLFEYVPLTGQFKEYLIEKKLLVEYLGDPIKKEAQTVSTWEGYINQGPAHREIMEWWKKNYRDFPQYNSPSFMTWAKWYMDKYRGEWGYEHKGPEETLEIMKKESLFPPFKSQDIPDSSYFYGGSADAGSYLSKVEKSRRADVDSLAGDVKSFITVLGNVAESMGAETPYITSGHRSREHQANIVYNNWLSNGGMRHGREYLVKIYGNKTGNQLADILENYSDRQQAISAITPHVRSRHMSDQAIDLRNTSQIKEVLYAIRDSGRFEMKIFDETDTAAPHWHITIYKDNGPSETLSRLSHRASILSKIAANK